MLTQRSLGFGLMFLFTATASNAAQPYLQDANPTTDTVSATAASTSSHLYPRVYFHEINGNVTAEQLSKYPFIVVHGNGFPLVSQAISGYAPDALVLRHVSGRAFQGFAYKDCLITAGIAFETTGPISQGGPKAKGCSVYAGHWLYRAGAPLTQSITASALTLKVGDAKRFTPGQFVVIYDAPAGSFNNAEHAKVTAVNQSTNTLTLQARGFKSAPKAHPAGAIVAQHVTGQGPENELWAFNTTSQSPKDGAGKTFGQFYADWLAANLNKHKDGATVGFNIAGILFDADLYIDLTSNQTDANNDLVRDDGWGANGVNWLGDGLDQLYAMVRSRLPTKYIMTGVHDARGFASTHGTEMENWLDYGNGDFKAAPKYANLNSLFSLYLFNMGETGRDAALTHNLSKSLTNLYPGNANPPPPNNRPARLGLALTLMDDGYYGTHSKVAPDAWFDEYAVNVTAGSSTYGEAINMYSAAAVRQHRGWLGRPKGPFRRLYNDADYAAAKSKLIGTFDSNINGWSGNRVNVSRITNAMDGTGALHASTMSPYTRDVNSATIKSPNVSLAGGKQYTIAFSARASKARIMRVSLGSFGERFMVGPNWRRYVISFQQNGSQSQPLLFSVGQENTQVDIDSVYVFEGNVNVFRRDFDKGIVVANATPVTQTIQLGGTFRKIKGRQDPTVNNGATVSSVTLPPYDALLLMRP